MTEHSITVAQEQGRRDYQEDRSFAKLLKFPKFECWLLAVMDGHGGSAVAEHCMGEIQDLFVPKDLEHIEEELRSLVSRLNSQTRRYSEGSTLSIACVFEDSKNQMKVSTAVLGDSPIVVFDDQGKLHVSSEHNVRSNLVEREAAISRGGTYYGGYLGIPGGSMGLQMSRALGDVALDSVLSREPEIRTIINPKWILVASDGLIDPGHSQSEALFQEIKDYAAAGFFAEDLMYWAIDRGLSDNATAVVWQ